MVKLETIGMYKTAKNDPTIIADGETINGAFVTKGADGKADAPVVTDVDLYVALNEINGDDAYNPKATIKDGEFINGYLVKAWEGQNLIVNEDNIAYASGLDYSDITAGTTVLVAGADKKLIIADGTTIVATDYGINFEVVDKVQLDGNAVKVKVVIA